MHLRSSSVARNRKFSKAVFRIRPRIKAFLDAFSQLDLNSNYYEAISVGITDEEIPERFSVEVLDGTLEIWATCSLSGTDDENLAEEFQLICRAIRLCPFAEPDLTNVERFLMEWEEKFLAPPA